MTVTRDTVSLNSPFTRFCVTPQRSFSSLTLFLCSVIPSTALIFTTIFTFFVFPLRKYGNSVSRVTLVFESGIGVTAAGGEKR